MAELRYDKIVIITVELRVNSLLRPQLLLVHPGVLLLVFLQVLVLIPTRISPLVPESQFVCVFFH